MDKIQSLLPPPGEYTEFPTFQRKLTIPQRIFVLKYYLDNITENGEPIKWLTSTIDELPKKCPFIKDARLKEFIKIWVSLNTIDESKIDDESYMGPEEADLFIQKKNGEYVAWIQQSANIGGITWLSEGGEMVSIVDTDIRVVSRIVLNPAQLEQILGVYARSPTSCENEFIW